MTMYRFTLQLFVIAIASIVSGCNPEQRTTYRPYVHLYKDNQEVKVKTLLDKWDSVRRPSPEFLVQLDSGWMFKLGDSTEGLTQAIIPNTTEPVTLPHRISAANRPMWYSQKVSLDTPGIFHIRGDDGVQLFINGKQVHRLAENFFVADFTGSADVSVRVLNNAMQGGLQRFYFMSHAQYDTFTQAHNNYVRLKHLVEQASLINQLTDEQYSSVIKAVDNPAVLDEAESNFDEYPFITGPWIIKEGTSYRVMAWVENDQEVTIRYGTTPDDLNSTLVAKGDVVSFLLPAGSPVHYQLLCRKTVSPTYAISTDEHEPFTFNAWADSQGGWPQFSRNLTNIEKYNDAFGLGAGDLVNNGSDSEQWREFYNVLSASASQRPYYVVSGNHDYDGFYDDLIPDLYRKLNPVASPHYYSWTYKNCAFIALDPNETFPIGILPGSQQYEWFQKELASEKWKSARWHFIFLHQPPYSQGWEGYTGDHFVRRLIEPVVEQASIDFVIAGHTHDYERLVKTYGQQKTVYLILGGGGGSLEPPQSSVSPKMDTVIKAHHIGHFYVNGDTLRFEALGLDGKVMDKYSAVKGSN